MSPRKWPVLVAAATAVVVAMLMLQTYVLNRIDRWFLS
jgi:hypothetical protein